MWNWLVKNKWKILLALTAAAIGYFANVLANKASERRIIEALKTEIEALKNKRMTIADQQRMAELQAQLKFLTEK